MSAYQTVAIAGATGNLGPSVLNALAAAGTFKITVLSRKATIPNLPSGVTVAQVDYSSHSSLVSALKGHDALVSVISDFDSQPALIDAAIEAGVSRFIPSEFGSDSFGNENARKLPVFGGKVKTQEYLASKKDQISYSFVINGAFLDWGIMVGFVISPKDEAENKIYDDGDRKRSMTLLSDVGKAVVGVLNHPEETKNKALYIQSAAVSQNQLLDIAQKIKPGLKVVRKAVDTADVEKNSYGILGQGKDANIGEAMIGFIIVSIFRDGYGGLFEKNDNELLGVKSLSEEELVKVVAQYV
ncbi:hypothetical protein AAFC00_004828 [Neodothiora populina]|uniref:NmrA-like domain-containing protein n=1 Tax=Neodothiora populina TaxID=2781224 RepID=A0ABR3P3B9_9PEZI